MADQGASQRRGMDTAQQTPIGQATTTSPQGSTGETYFDGSLGPTGGNDTPGARAGYKDTQVTQIGLLGSPIGTNAVSSSQGTSYRETAMVTGGNDSASTAVKSKEIQVYPIGQNTSATETSSAHGIYFESTLGAITPIGGTTAAAIYYKLRARDTGASYVEWVTTVTPLSTSSYPGTPVGTLVELTVLSQHT